MTTTSCPSVSSLLPEEEETPFSVSDHSSSCSSNPIDELFEWHEKESSDVRNNVYNVKNVMITVPDIEQIFITLGLPKLPICRLDIYQRAFVHKSYSIHNHSPSFLQFNHEMSLSTGAMPLQPLSNERDEFFGDGFLDCIIAKYLYERYDDQNEGFLTRTRTKLVNANILCTLSERIGLHRFVLLSKHVEENCLGRSLTSILGDMLEAFISAIYQDQYYYAEEKIQQRKQLPLPGDIQSILSRIRKRNGMEDVRRLEEWIGTFRGEDEMISPSGYAFQKTEEFIVRLIEKYVDFDELIINETNYKDILLKYFQKKYKGAPEYREISVEGPAHKRTFRISVHHVIDGEFLGAGEGKTKKDAQQLAAKNALEKMGVEAKYI